MKIFSSLLMYITNGKKDFLKNIVMCICFFFFLLSTYNKTHRINQQHKQDNSVVIAHQFYDLNRKNFINEKTFELQNTNFINRNKNIYGLLTVLKMSNFYLNKEDLNQSIKILQQGLESTKEQFFLDYIRIKIAKINIQKNDFISSLQTLNLIKNKNLNSEIFHMKGDIFYCLNKKKIALKFWKTALKLEKNNTLRKVLTMKIQTCCIT
ncbi:tetratricopeptide repeat protein [Buchnera aphidicola (Thelaxes californica)]|uniref:Ancillary SecYEG translocon subunit n=1 Tax=Buchnera aphidicola (Thelaxes californica) TaxID=1315998 RepID=A0A4D6YAF3_9GAMM|nr:tetratricopeptide repeat protein [Buchnera aphidicola]QCI26986.1 tetratricopeptide repeat protein [Buchnera aphidicola (Thelaxes californica)]